MTVDHLPDRPGWGCQACDNPWPCDAAKLRLTREYAEHSAPLAMYLTSQMVVAAGDLGDKVTAGDLLRRFLGWLGGPVL